MIKNFTHRKGWLLLFYFILFLLFFLSYPLNSSLPSDGDAWYHIAKFNFYLNKIIELFTSQDTGQFFYPDSLPHLNGEPAFGIFLLWLTFKIMIQNDLWTYYLLFTSILTLNSFSVFFLSKTFNNKLSNLSAFVVGLIFSLNMFVFANIDNVNTLFFAPGILAILFFYKAIFQKEKSAVLYFSLFFLFQLVSSIYNFMYACIFIFVTILINHKSFASSFKKNIKFWITSFFSGVALSLAYVYYVVFYKDTSNYWTPNDNLESVKVASFTLDDFVRVLPNTLYSSNEPIVFIFEYQSLFLGFILSIAFLFGVYKNGFKNIELILTVIVSIIIGGGVYIKLSDQTFLLPLGFLYEKINIYHLFRFPYRIFLMILLIICIFFSYTLYHIESTFKYGRFLIILIVFGVILENMPLKRSYFDFYKINNEANFLKEKLKVNCETIFFLPFEDYIEMGTPKRNKTSYIFMYWQTIIKKNVLNGCSAIYPPYQRKINNFINNDNFNNKSFINLMEDMNVCCIISYSDSWNFSYASTDTSLLEDLKKNNDIILIER